MPEEAGSNSNGWQQDQKLVLHELRRLDKSLEKLGDRVDNGISHERNNRRQVEQGLSAEIQTLAIKVASLQIKCGIYATIGASIPVLASLVIRQL